MTSFLSALFIFCLVAMPGHAAKQVELNRNQLWVDGEAQPQLFGAELQYFRLRGGYGPNQPRQKVMDLWRQAIDRMVEAKMNAVSFYIPWDFHEYAEGQFDFNGTVDQDGDGNADYPSRDVLTFIKMLKAAGISKMMVRPGPYINAEWGFLGFGAIPSWFHDKYPGSHMQVDWGWPMKLYDYHNADLLRHTRLWFEALYKDVLRSEIGGEGPVLFMQLDNETNFQWQSLYVGDYSAVAKARYREFLKSSYGDDLAKVNAQHRTRWERWEDVRPPKKYGDSPGEDRDWYRFQDESIHTYLEKIRRIWEDIGVREPNVIFTLAESYNAPDRGLLPNYLHRNDPRRTGMMTVNLYPKTFETHDRTLMNSPFKADLDVKAADEANNYYTGSKQDWVLGPEIQGGWWRGIDVSSASRQQTYLSVLGHGMKALFVYYFNEGQNWGVEWAQERIRPLFNQLREELKVVDIPAGKLSNEFWGELQARSDRTIVMGYDVRRLMQVDLHEEKELFFDAPLDGEAKPRDHFFELKAIGERVIAPYQKFLAESVAANDKIALVKDVESHLPSVEMPSINAGLAAADWSGGLLGYMMNASLNPRVLIGEISQADDFNKHTLVHLDTGSVAARSITMFTDAFRTHGRTVINFVGSRVARALNLAAAATPRQVDNQSLTYFIGPYGELRSKAGLDTQERTILGASQITTYDRDSIRALGCKPILFWQHEVVGYSCSAEKGNAFVQIGAQFFADYNLSHYAMMADATARRQFLEAVLRSSTDLFEDNEPESRLLELPETVEKTVAFARVHPTEPGRLWITIKAGRKESQTFRLKISRRFVVTSLKPVRPNTLYVVRNLLSGTVSSPIPARQLSEQGFEIRLKGEGSAVYVVEREGESMYSAERE